MFLIFSNLKNFSSKHETLIWSPEIISLLKNKQTKNEQKTQECVPGISIAVTVFLRIFKQEIFKFEQFFEFKGIF